MSDCRHGGRDVPERLDAVEGGVLSMHPLYSREVYERLEAIEVAGVRFERADGARVSGLEGLVRDMWLTWKLLDERGEGKNSFHNGWKTFTRRMVELGIEVGEEGGARCGAR